MIYSLQLHNRHYNIVKELILSYCNDSFVAIKDQLEIFVAINCNNKWYKVIAMISSFNTFRY